VKRFRVVRGANARGAGSGDSVIWQEANMAANDETDAVGADEESIRSMATTEGSLALALAATDADEAQDEEGGRRRRRNRARAQTISIRRLSKAELNRGRQLYPETDYWKPKTRSECADMERPCPFVSCKYHLYVDVHPVRGSIKVNFTDVEVWEMTETCALDIADRGGITLEEVGEIMNLTRERVRQVETAGLSKLAALKDVMRLKDYVG
jgi:hypothetical protein